MPVTVKEGQPHYTPPVESFGDRVRRARRQEGIDLSQFDLAEAIGITQTRLGSWESNVSTPPDREIVGLAKKIGEITFTPWTWIVTGVWDPEATGVYLDEDGWSLTYQKLSPQAGKRRSTTRAGLSGWNTVPAGQLPDLIAS